MRRDLAAVHFEHDQAAHIIAATLYKYLPRQQSIVWLCIGSERSTGDALGPLVGTELSRRGINNVLGTLKAPVHADNLNEVRVTLRRDFPGAYVVAIDAMLGAFDKVGYIYVREGAVMPGAGVGKTLPPIGYMHIVGVVNIGGTLEQMVLMTTPLSRVMVMADVIADGIGMVVAMREVVQDAAAATGAAT
jgi:putative sporulation protein YyaC